MWRNVSNLFGTGLAQPSPNATAGQLQQTYLYQSNSKRDAAGQAYYEKTIKQAEIEIQRGTFNQAKEDELISLYLDGPAPRFRLIFITDDDGRLCKIECMIGADKHLRPMPYLIFYSSIKIGSSSGEKIPDFS